MERRSFFKFLAAAVAAKGILKPADVVAEAPIIETAAADPVTMYLYMPPAFPYYYGTCWPMLKKVDWPPEHIMGEKIEISGEWDDE